MLTLDARRYYELSFNGKISFASRIYAGTSWGRDKRQYAIGGIPWVGSSDSELINTGYQTNLNNIGDDYYYMNNFAFPIRGYELGARYGNKALLMNFELRLPMLMYYFPTIEYLGQLFGVFFVDMGVAWNDDFPNYHNRSSWEDNDDGEGWIMSYGFGPRFIFLGMPWKLDYAWEYDPYEGKKTDRKWYLSIGLDF
jgi:outer membrane protein assembly factor BamA